jgi:hypothetical protein
MRNILYEYKTQLHSHIHLLSVSYTLINYASNFDIQSVILFDTGIIFDIFRIENLKFENINIHRIFSYHILDLFNK